MTTHEWTEFYSAAVLESDWTQLDELITAAEMAILSRLNEFAQDHGGTPEENQAIINALNSLKVLRADLASWLLANSSSVSRDEPKHSEQAIARSESEWPALIVDTWAES